MFVDELADNNTMASDHNIMLRTFVFGTLALLITDGRVIPGTLNPVANKGIGPAKGVLPYGDGEPVNITHGNGSPGNVDGGGPSSAREPNKASDGVATNDGTYGDAPAGLTSKDGPVVSNYSGSDAAEGGSAESGSGDVVAKADQSVGFSVGLTSGSEEPENGSPRNTNKNGLPNDVINGSPSVTAISRRVLLNDPSGGEASEVISTINGSISEMKTAGPFVAASGGEASEVISTINGFISEVETAVPSVAASGGSTFGGEISESRSTGTTKKGGLSTAGTLRATSSGVLHGSKAYEKNTNKIRLSNTGTTVSISRSGIAEGSQLTNDSSVGETSKIGSAMIVNGSIVSSDVKPAEDASGGLISGGAQIVNNITEGEINKAYPYRGTSNLLSSVSEQGSSSLSGGEAPESRSLGNANEGRLPNISGLMPKGIHTLSGISAVEKNETTANVEADIGTFGGVSGGLLTAGEQPVNNVSSGEIAESGSVGSFNEGELSTNSTAVGTSGVGLDSGVDTSVSDPSDASENISTGNATGGEMSEGAAQTAYGGNPSEEVSSPLFGTKIVSSRDGSYNSRPTEHLSFGDRYFANSEGEGVTCQEFPYRKAGDSVVFDGIKLNCKLTVFLQDHPQGKEHMGQSEKITISKMSSTFSDSPCEPWKVWRGEKGITHLETSPGCHIVIKEKRWRVNGNQGRTGKIIRIKYKVTSGISTKEKQGPLGNNKKGLEGTFKQELAGNYEQGMKGKAT